MKTEAEIKDTLAIVTRSKNRIKATGDLQVIARTAIVVDILNWVLDNPTTFTSLVDALKTFDANVSRQ